MELVVGKFLLLVAVYLFGIVLAVVLHELGHAVAGLFTTKQRMKVEIGQSGRSCTVRLGRLDFRLSGKGLRYGATRYDRDAEPVGRQVAVALGGPIASLIAVMGFAWLTSQSVVGTVVWICWLALCVANFRVWIVAVWPIEYRPSGESGEVWASDGLDIWRMLKRK